MITNLDGFHVSDNINVRIDLGRRVVSNNPGFYTEAVCGEIMDSVRRKSGETDPDKLQELFYHSIYCYWANGAISDEFFILSFADKTDKEIKEYITTREKLIYVKHLDKKEDIVLLNDKYETYKKLPEYFKRDVICVNGPDDYAVFYEFVSKHPEFVVKPKNLGRARGIHYDTVKGFSDAEIKAYYNQLLDEGKENNRKYKESVDDSIVLEEIIQEDPAMAVLHPGSVNAVRIHTILNDGKVSVWRPWIKTGRGDHFITAAFVGSPCAGIDAETGVIITKGHTENLEVFDTHPDTGIPFVGFQIPRWDEVINMCKEMALKLPTLRYIGWDMVLSDKGWCAMEANDKAEMIVQQMSWHKPMKAEFESEIGWNLPKGFWWEN